MKHESRPGAPEPTRLKRTPKPLDDEEAKGVVGGTGNYSQEQYDNWEGQGPADRSGHGPGSGE